MRDIPPSSNDFFDINDKDYILLVSLPEPSLRQVCPTATIRKLPTRSSRWASPTSI